MPLEAKPFSYPRPEYSQNWKHTNSILEYMFYPLFALCSFMLFLSVAHAISRIFECQSLEITSQTQFKHPPLTVFTLKASSVVNLISDPSFYLFYKGKLMTKLDWVFGSKTGKLRTQYLTVCS